LVEFPTKFPTGIAFLCYFEKPLSKSNTNLFLNFILFRPKLNFYVLLSVIYANIWLLTSLT